MSIDKIPVNDRREMLVATGGQQLFTFDFPIYNSDELSVFMWREGYPYQLTYPLEYSVTGAGEQGGGVVTLNTPTLTGDIIIICSAQAYARATRFTEGGDLPAASINAEYNRIIIMLQQLLLQISQTLRLPVSDPTNVPLLAKPARNNRLVGFDSKGDLHLVPYSDAGSGGGEGSNPTILLSDILVLHGTTDTWIDLAPSDSILRGGRFNPVVNRGGMLFNFTTGLVTVARAGTYRVSGVLRVDPSTGFGGGGWYVTQNGVPVRGIQAWPASASTIDFSWVGVCAAGDTLGLLSHEGDPPRIWLWGTATQVYVELEAYIGELTADALQRTVGGHISVEATASTPPATPQDGDLYIVGSSPVAPWSSWENGVVEWIALDGTWRIHYPEPGWLAWDKGVNRYKVYDQYGHWPWLEDVLAITGGSGPSPCVATYQLSDDITGPVVPTVIEDDMPGLVTLTGLAIFLPTVSTSATSVRLHHMRAGSSLANVLATITAGQRSGAADFPTARAWSAGDYHKLEVVDAGNGMGLKAKVLGIYS